MPPLLHNIILSQPPLIQRSLGSNKRTRGIKNPYPYPYLTPIPTQKKMKEKKSIYIEVIKILAYFSFSSFGWHTIIIRLVLRFSLSFSATSMNNKSIKIKRTYRISYKSKGIIENFEINQKLEKLN